MEVWQCSILFKGFWTPLMFRLSLFACSIIFFRSAWAANMAKTMVEPFRGSERLKPPQESLYGLKMSSSPLFLDALRTGVLFRYVFLSCAPPPFSISIWVTWFCRKSSQCGLTRHTASFRPQNWNFELTVQQGSRYRVGVSVQPPEIFLISLDFNSYYTA